MALESLIHKNKTQSKSQTKSFVASQPVVQKKLSIGASDDPYEAEADTVADRVVQQINTPPIQPTTGVQLQKKCAACEDEEIRKKPLAASITSLVQKKTSHNPASQEYASTEITHEINNSLGGGSLMDHKTRSTMEQGFGNDFSQVCIHTDSTAKQLSKSLHAQAFTVGNDIFFNEGKYNPDSTQGKHLLAHELTHVIQQEHASQNTIRRTPVSTANLPTFGQLKDTCASASQISALLIQGKNSGNNSSIIAAIENVITWLIQYKSRYIKNLKGKRFTNAKDLQKVALSSCYAIRDSLLAGTGMTQNNYRELATVLHLYYSSSGSLDIGLSGWEIDNVRMLLGIDGGAKAVLQNGSDLFNNTVINGLKSGQTAQVGWFVKTQTYNDGKYSYGYHAFLIGRTATGDWFLHDQGYTPAKAFADTTKSGLKIQIQKAVKDGNYWLMFNKPSLPAVGVWLGAKLLNTRQGPQTKQGELLPNGTYLAEIDYSSWRSSDMVYSGNFLGVARTIKDSYKVVRTTTSGKGAVLIEMPRGTFLLYETNSIATHNLQADSIDKSGGGKLSTKKYYRAYLFLTDGSKEKIIKVY